jgi:hypothetical protein
MLNSLLRPVLVIVVGFLLRLALAAIGVEIDEAIFNTIVAAIVTYFLALIGAEGTANAVAHFRK